MLAHSPEAMGWTPPAGVFYAPRPMADPVKDTLLGQLAAIEPLSDEDLRSPERTRWPLQDRPFGEIVAWVNLELMKNAAEIGYARFVLAVPGGSP